MALLLSIPAAAQDVPPAPDDDTMLLLHLDGDAKDASGRGNHAQARGAVQWVAGRSGQALYLDGQSGLEIGGSGTTYVGERSWTIEFWFKPEKQQPQHAYLISSGWSHKREYGVRLSGQSLVVRFFNGPNGGQLVTPGLGQRLFDGAWHHVAVVLDRERGGEVRLYLDGERIRGKAPVFCPPIHFDDEKMGVVLGASSPWSAPWKSAKYKGYRGAIDEVRLSAVVRPAYAADEPLPAAAQARLDARRTPARRLAFDPGETGKPLPLDPKQTLLVVPERYVASGNFEAARELQRWLRKAAGVENGFRTVNEKELQQLGGQTIIALGRTQWVEDGELDGLPDVGFILKRKGNVLVVAGPKGEGTYYGALRLLDLALGVRFYMPTPLFTSAPKRDAVIPGGLDLRVVPFVQSAMMTGIAPIPGDDGWVKRNAVSRRLGGTHQHNMYHVFPPERYAESHPDIYPIIKGERYVPERARDQKWQPNLSSPELVEVAVASAKRYFAQNPDHLYLSFGVQDGHVVCQCDRCQAVYARYKEKAKDARQAQARGFSAMYWQFINDLALRLEDEVPGKLIVAMVYGPARYPPTFELPGNVLLFTNYHLAELDADPFMKPNANTGRSPLDRVLARSSHYGNHDWYHGRGFLVPRVYSGYWSRFMRKLAAETETAFMHAEAYPNWGLDGPKYYIAARLWWEPDLDVDVLLRQFTDDLFGPASDAMYAYFTTLEQLWITLDNVKGPERKLFNWERQFTADADDLAEVRRARALLDEAMGQARTEAQKQRVRLFSDTFHVTETLFAFGAAETISRADYEAFQRHLDQKILPHPMTLYRPKAKDTKELERHLRAALKWATKDGKKVR